MIKFYKKTGQYGCFCNFSNHAIVIHGKSYPTSEHYYQSRKFNDPDLQERVRLCEKPRMAFNIGNDKSLPIRDDWESIKISVMRDALVAKVKQHPEVLTTLLSTGNQEIIEDSPIDYFWGCGADGSGKNHLGRLWMEIRSSLSYK